MNSAATRSEIRDSSGADRPPQRAGGGLRDLFALLGDLLIDGGDTRLALDRPWGRSAYGCGPAPMPDLLCFSSSTASPISECAYAHVERAREQLMHAAISIGLEAALDRRTEEMRCELRQHLALPDDVDIVFSPSGTDSQLHALALTRALLGDAVTSVIVASDQTGSGTAASMRGSHFSTRTANGVAVTREAPIEGLSGEAVPLPLLDGGTLQPRSDIDAAVLGAVDAQPAEFAQDIDRPDPAREDLSAPGTYRAGEGEHKQALRTTYRTLMMRIAACDVAGTFHGRKGQTTPQPEVGFRQITDLTTALADAALTASLACAVRTIYGDEPVDAQLAVMAMGKCGAGELNYISDVDVMFVVSEATPRAIRLAAEFNRIGSTTFFEVDANLRPEGKSGALVRTLESHVAYYKRWAETWEFQ
ncbi:MAG: hypothetical protein E6699_19160, partial [Bradyrhizobium sp.]|nr:hypothetical protein [Bradyrhizobium sp.]